MGGAMKTWFHIINFYPTTWQTVKWWDRSWWYENMISYHQILSHHLTNCQVMG